ncbi:MAG: DUF5654 family protein [Nanoarchaeota archaeon]
MSKIKRKFLNVFHVGKRFKNELRRQIRMLLVFTMGFTIAFSWRQTIFELSQNFVKFLTKIENPNVSTILTSIFITILALILIYIASYYLKDSPENY